MNMSRHHPVRLSEDAEVLVRNTFLHFRTEGVPEEGEEEQPQVVRADTAPELPRRKSSWRDVQTPKSGTAKDMMPPMPGSIMASMHAAASAAAAAAAAAGTAASMPQMPPMQHTQCTCLCPVCAHTRWWLSSSGAMFGMPPGAYPAMVAMPALQQTEPAPQQQTASVPLSPSGRASVEEAFSHMPSECLALAQKSRPLPVTTALGAAIPPSLPKPEASVGGADSGPKKGLGLTAPPRQQRYPEGTGDYDEAPSPTVLGRRPATAGTGASPAAQTNVTPSAPACTGAPPSPAGAASHPSPSGPIATVGARLPRAASSAVITETDGSNTKVAWTLEAWWLFRRDKTVVSPEFMVNIPGLGPQPFKILIAADTTKGGFNDAGGRGRIELKWSLQTTPMQAPPKLAFFISTGKPAGARDSNSGRPTTERRGPVVHDFAQSCCCGLPRSENIWDLLAAVDQPTRQFMVSLDIAPA